MNEVTKLVEYTIKEKKTGSNTVDNFVAKQLFSSLTFVTRQAHLIPVEGNHISYFRAKKMSQKALLCF